ncbi:MAG: AAA family ATPase [Nitrososphaerota archaeon]|jgi:nitric oxide reductase NorQ protein|nr:AAA family ATPase [Nitrososphaerota archaeon]
MSYSYSGKDAKSELWEYDTKSYRAAGLDTKLVVNVLQKPKFGRLDFIKKYHVEKYNLAEGYAMNPTMRTMVPRGTPEYVERGENYVERIMRALFHFKQCALIGPSGTGKSIVATEVVYVKDKGKVKAMNIGHLFDRLSAYQKVEVDGDGWEVIRDPDIMVLSYDPKSRMLNWAHPAAVSRTIHSGEVVTVRTKGNRELTATPDHSFMTGDGPMKASELVAGVTVPAIGSVPEGSPTVAAMDEIVMVEREEYDGHVYDFQVPGNETFVAGVGGIVTHNTHITYLVSELAGLPMWEINCGLQTSVYDLFGRFVGLGRENWIDGQIVSWCRYGGILYLDEANMMKQDIATRLNPILDTRGHMVLNERDNEVIPRHPNGFVVISMNPYSAEFSGTKPLNAAFRRRMSVWIDFDYLSVGNKIADDEVQLVAKKAKIDRGDAEKIVKSGAEMRRRYKAGDLPYAPSVGDLVNWGTLVRDGMNIISAAEETIIAVTSDDLEVQNQVRRIVQTLASTEKAQQARA